MKRTFKVGDKVFAKVRGYPAWPARVEKIVEISSTKCKYHVFFYGTSETAVCKVEDLYNYEEHKGKLGKPSKRKGFNEAIAQMEGLTLVPVRRKQEAKIKEEPEGCDVEGNVMDENPKQTGGKKKPGKRKRDGVPKDLDSKSSINCFGGGGNSIGSYKRTSIPPQKRFKKVSSSPSTESANSGPSDGKFMNGLLAASNKIEIISRSGRKIKPKKFADEEAFDHITLNAVCDVNQKVIGETVGNKRLPSSGHLTSNLAGTEKPIRVNVRNPSFMNEPVPGCSTMPPEGYSREDGHFMLPNNGKPLSKMDRLMWFRIEARMLEIETLIRGNLSVRRANTTQSINLLKQLCDLDTKPLMLKKHPQVVKTIKKVRRYVGNPEAWNLTDVEKTKFSNDAQEIRTIGDVLYTKFREMFSVPEDSTFWQIFLNVVSAFKKRIESLPIEKVCALVVDPTTTSANLQNIQSDNQTEGQSIGIESNIIREIKKEPLDECPVSEFGLNCPFKDAEKFTEPEMLKTDPGSKQIDLIPVKCEVDVNKNMTENGGDTTE